MGRLCACGLALLLTALLAGCGSSGPAEVQVEELVEGPAIREGKLVTFRGAVSNPIDHRVWEMAGGRLFVIYDHGLDRGLEEGERLRVTGAVHRFDKATIEGELGVNIEDHFFEDEFLADDVAFVADEVERPG